MKSTKFKRSEFKSILLNLLLIFVLIFNNVYYVLAQNATSSALIIPSESPTSTPTPIDLPTPQSDWADQGSQATSSAATITPTPTLTLTPTPAVILPTFEPALTPSATSALSGRLRGKPKIRLGKKNFRSTESVVIPVDYGNEPGVKIELYNPRGEKIEKAVYRQIAESTTTLLLPSNNDFKPGKYTLIVTDTDGTKSSQDFSWGVLAINPSKSIYLPKEKAALYMAVLDDRGEMVCDADVTLNITDPDGKKTVLTTKDGKIKVNNSCGLKELGLESDYETGYQPGPIGRYNLELTATSKNGTFSTGDFFEVRGSVPFDIVRDTATRIFPIKNYPVIFDITAYEDFKGTIEETVPQSFATLPVKDVRTYDKSEIVTISPDTDSMFINLRKPFDGDYAQTLGFGETPTDQFILSQYQQFGLSGHDGVDFALPKGTPVLAADSGKVILAGPGAYGLTVVIEHRWGRSYYGHLSDNEVNLGDKVQQGQAIGISGDTGLVTAAHLHFGIKLKKNDLGNGYYGKSDPLPYLSGSSLVSENAAKKLIWNVDLKKGDKLKIGYQYDPPDTSPEYYLLGPLKFIKNGVTNIDQNSPFVLGQASESAQISNPQSFDFVQDISVTGNSSIVFQELRQWQIASDTSGDIAHDTTVTGNNGSGAGTVTASGMTTSGTSRLILISITTDSSTRTVSSVDDNGPLLSYTLVKSYQSGLTLNTEVWRGKASTAMTSSTITATLSTSGKASIVVSSYSGINTAGTDGEGAIGNVLTSATTGANASMSMTTTANNSLVISSLAVNNNPTLTAGTNQTINGQNQATTTPLTAQERQNSITPAKGTSVTSSYNHASQVWAMISVELRSQGPGDIRYEAYVSGNNSAGAGTVATSTGITTNGPDRLLIATVSTDGTGAAATTVSSIAGASLTWVNVTGVTNATTFERVEIWRAFASTSISSQTITATLSGSDQAAIVVTSFIGANNSGTNGSGAIGATATATGSSAAPSVALTTKGNNSLVISGLVTNANPSLSPGTDQQILSNSSASSAVLGAMATRKYLTPAGGTSITSDYTLGTSNPWGIIGVEIFGYDPGIVFDAASSRQLYSSGANLTFSFTVESLHASRLLVVTIARRSGDATSTVTYAGTGMSLIATQTQGSANRAEIFYLKAPATGANNVIITPVTTGPDFAASASLYYFVDQSVVFDVTNGGSSGTLGNVVDTVTTHTSNQLLVDVISHESASAGTIPAGSGQTAIHLTDEGQWDSAASFKIVQGVAGDYDMGIDNGSSATYAHAVVSFRPLQMISQSGYRFFENANGSEDDTTAVKINDASNFSAMPENGRQVVRTTGGTLYAFVNKAGTCEVWTSTDGSSWSKPATGVTCGTSTALAMAIDSSNNLHLMYFDGTSDIIYRLYTTSSDSFGSPETAFDGISSSDGYNNFFDLAVDSSNIPHAIASYSDDAGTTSNADYSNRIGGSWKAPVTMTSVSGIDNMKNFSLTLDGSGIPQAAYLYAIGLDLYAAIGNANNATSFSSGGGANTIVDSIVNVTTTSSATSIAIDASGNTWIAYLDENGSSDYATLAKHTSGDAWTSWTSGLADPAQATEPSIAINSNDVYVFYTGTSSYLYYNTYRSGMWLGPRLINSVTTSVDIHAKWSYNNNNQGSTQIDYLYHDGTDTYWNKLTLGTRPTAVGNALAALNTNATAPAAGTVFRLRLLLHNTIFGISGATAFKLQFAQVGTDGVCDANFDGETYSDLSTTGNIKYDTSNNAVDADFFTRSADDPTHGSDSIIIHSYEEANNFDTFNISTGDTDSMWDFALNVDSGAPASTKYCFRAYNVTASSNLSSYSVIPEITTAAAVSGPTTDQQLRHGNWFNNGIEQSFTF